MGKQKRVIVIAAAALIGSIASATATAEEININEPVVRGEVARLLRQAYDYEHRNSNRNVFRRSKHFSPTGNIFRSSQYYQRKLAASSDGYPVRTTTRFARSVNGGKPEIVEYSYAHHRRSPFGLPTIEERGLEALVLSGADRTVGRAGVDDYYVVEHSNERAHDRRSQLHEDYAWPDCPENENAIPDRPAQQAVFQKVVQADGSTKVIITSVPADESDAAQDQSIDGAWSHMENNNFSAAANLFTQFTTDSDRGAEALVGYGLAKLLAGDTDDSARALRRAERIDENIFVKVLLSQSLRDQLQSARGEFSNADNDQANHAMIATALQQLLD